MLRRIYISQRSGLKASPQREAIEAFLENPWFQRRWVLQELALAQTAVFYLGRFELSSSLLVGAFQQILHDERELSQSVMVVIRTLVLLVKVPTNPLKLLSLIWAFSDTKCSDPRDRIQALCGLASVAEWSKFLHSTLSGNYEISWTKLYQNYAAAEINRGFGARILYQIFGFGSLRHSSQAAPSWVPNWSQPKSFPLCDPNCDLELFDRSRPLDSLSALIKLKSPTNKPREGFGLLLKDYLLRCEYASSMVTDGDWRQVQIVLRDFLGYHFLMRKTRKFFLPKRRTILYTAGAIADALNTAMLLQTLPVLSMETGLEVLQSVLRRIKKGDLIDDPADAMVPVLNVLSILLHRLVLFYARNPRYTYYYIGLGPRDTAIGDSIALLGDHTSQIAKYLSSVTHTWTIVVLRVDQKQIQSLKSIKLVSKPLRAILIRVGIMGPLDDIVSHVYNGIKMNSSLVIELI